MSKVFFDERVKKYCIYKDGQKIYLNCGTKVEVLIYDSWITGTIQYSIYWHNGYYFLSDKGSKLKLTDSDSIKIIPFESEV